MLVTRALIGPIAYSSADTSETTSTALATMTAVTAYCHIRRMKTEKFQIKHWYLLR
jgi:hypothetical protein